MPDNDPPANPVGRPSLLTPEVIEDVRRLLPTCLYLETVADYIGVSRMSFHHWLKRGRKEADRLSKKGAKPRPREALYAEFFYVHKKSLAEGQLHDLGVIKKASADQVIPGTDDTPPSIRKGEWQAAAWRLERRFPQQWGKKERTEVTGKNGGELVVRVIEAVVDGPSEDPGRDGPLALLPAPLPPE